MLVVMKFGGTSVGSVAALENVVQIIDRAHRQGDEVVAVVSAMSGVTNLLLEGAHKAEEGDTQPAKDAYPEMLRRHTEVMETMVPAGASRDAVLSEITTLLEEYDALCDSIRVLGELTPRALDVIGGMGERMNVHQVASILQARGIDAVPVEATALIVTDERYGAASPLMVQTSTKSQAVLSPLLAAGKVPVVTGFIGATEKGITTTLGRGGSDYSATILARALGADEVWIWTDVNGVMTTDPRIVPDARTIRRLSYAEVGEMAYFGAKVLHPQAIRPVKQSAIPARILNTFAPDHPGTLVTKNVDGSGRTIKAITLIKGLSMVILEGAGMLGVPGVAARTFGAVARAGTSVLMISQSSSEQSICFVVPTAEVQQTLVELKEEMSRELERHDIDSIWTQDEIVIVAVVGAGMKGIPGIASKVFGALGREKINVIAVAQGSSEYNISIVIDQKDAEDAVRCLHAEAGLAEEL
jgi:bifunctional aspartokinase / homoserine dehydrogenase 1